MLRDSRIENDSSSQWSAECWAKPEGCHLQPIRWVMHFEPLSFTKPGSDELVAARRVAEGVNTGKHHLPYPLSDSKARNSSYSVQVG